MCFMCCGGSSHAICPPAEDWDMLEVDEEEKLTGEEEFELLAGPLGLSERRIVPEAVQFPDSDPLGASIAMVTATNSMEETLLQIGEETLIVPSGFVLLCLINKTVITEPLCVFRLSDLGG